MATITVIYDSNRLTYVSVSASTITYDRVAESAVFREIVSLCTTKYLTRYFIESYWLWKHSITASLRPIPR